MKILILLALCSLALGEVKKCKVFIALCDNDSQGILPVGEKIGDGDKPEANLYWGCYDGFGSFFKRSKTWKTEKLEKDVSEHILRRLQVQHTSKDALIVADAYKGTSMRECIQDFEKAIHSGDYDLVAYIGHNAYMDFKPEAPIVSESSTDVIVLACKSQGYFQERLEQMNAKPILLTSQFMYPGSFIIHEAIEPWLIGGSLADIRAAAGKAYAKNQKISVKAGTGVFAHLEK